MLREIEHGASIDATSRKYRYAPDYVKNLCHAAGIETPTKRHKASVKRAFGIVADIRQGKTLAEAARRHGTTREYARQIEAAAIAEGIIR